MKFHEAICRVIAPFESKRYSFLLLNVALSNIRAFGVIEVKPIPALDVATDHVVKPIC